MTKSKEETIVGRACVGYETTLSPKHTLCFAFHNFEKLPHERGERTYSPFLPCHGYLWRLELYPGGRKKSNTETTQVSLHLHCKHPENKKAKVEANFGIRFDDSIMQTCNAHTFNLVNKSRNWGWANFCKRKSVLENHLHNQTLIVQVDIAIYMKKEEVWTPSKTNISGKLLNMLQTGEDSDVTFIVGGKKFTPHKLIISMGAPGLRELIDDSVNEEEIIIDNVDPSIFHSFLRFLYTNKLPLEKEFNRNARDLLNIANKFGCTELKLHAEAWLATHDINKTNVSDLLLYADAMCCPLLKEKAMEYFIAHSSAVMSTKERKELRKTNVELFADLMEIIYTNEHKSLTDHYGDETVSGLRRKLEEKGLDIDGTREMLVKRLLNDSNE